ncbi:hypothetical protein MLD38_005272 [Melastoma candidum]|uniref:Uncharacterized protein n=1 Tax=Melastoma candidum TaxID=119954 RepID=A0ACB9S7I2_9MYRT|nr:hypothetical protein MLD38_005272 [Melastoma candidum]
MIQNYWETDAKEFKPERFASGISKVAKNKNDQVGYFPFGWGPRTCLGQNYAIIEGKIALTIFLRHFSFEISPAYRHALTTIISVRPQHGHPLILHKLLVQRLLSVSNFNRSSSLDQPNAA